MITPCYCSAYKMAEEIDALQEKEHFDYVVGYADPKLILKALESGSSLADDNILGIYTMKDIDPKTLQLHFDSCISARMNNNEKEDTVVTFDYKTILPRNTINNEIKTIRNLTQISRLHQLLTHPLISSFIYMKWHRMRWFFYSNLALISVFWITLAVCMCLSDRVNALYYFSKTILIATYLTILAREAFQVFTLKQAYFIKVSNWFEIAMIFFCFFAVFNPIPEYHKQFSALSLLSVVLELAMVVKGHPQASKYIILLRVVTLTFFRFFVSYLTLLIAFTLSFYKLFYDQRDIMSLNVSPTEASTEDYNEASTEDYTETENDIPGFFHGISFTFFNIILMLTGEINSSSYNFESFIHGILFIIFMLLVPIILFNLLCGLAVCDVDMIRENSDVLSCMEMVKFIVFTEKYVRSLSKLTPRLSFLEGKIFLHPYYLRYKKISARLYDGKTERTSIDKLTIKRLKQFLFHNDNDQIINQLQIIVDNRTKIRELQLTKETLTGTIKMMEQELAEKF